MVRWAVSETYNNDIIFKTGPRICYTILVYKYTLNYDTVLYITIQFSVFNSCTAQQLLQFVYVQFLYNSSTTVQLSQSYCIFYCQLTVVYDTTLI